MPVITITLTDDEAAAVQAQVATPDAPAPDITPHVTAMLRDTIIAPLIEAQRKAKVAALVDRLRDGGLLDKLAQLEPDQQTALQAQVEKQVDGLLAATSVTAAVIAEA